MNAQPAAIVSLAILLTLPAAVGDGGDVPVEPHVREEVKDTVGDLIGQCSNNTPGDQVGYRNGITDVRLAGGLYIALDMDYGAFGIFDGGNEERHGDTTYTVYTILSGYSESADWCDRLVGGLAFEGDR